MDLARGKCPIRLDPRAAFRALPPKGRRPHLPGRASGGQYAAMPWPASMRARRPPPPRRIAASAAAGSPFTTRSACARIPRSALD